MSIETLNSAARAAGFAMAGSEGLDEERKSVDGLETSEWQPSEALLHRGEASAAPQSSLKVALSDWVKGVFTSGRGAPA
jgi:hypothetical protein